MRAVLLQIGYDDDVPAAQRRSDWEVFTIPPQTSADDEAYFRCVFGRGERSKPLQLQAP